MKVKWYTEFLIILIAIVAAIFFATNISLPTFTGSPKISSTDSLGAHPKPAQNEQWSNGKSLFKANCASCHNPNADGTGPALKGVEARWQAAGSYKNKTGKQWLYTWVKNWHDVVDSGYKYGIEMANSRPAEMNIFNNLSDKDIDDILYYINHQQTMATIRP